jgi:hypothetical protein
MKPVRLLPEAQEELEAAAVWYEERSVGLGEAFARGGGGARRHRRSSAPGGAPCLGEALCDLTGTEYTGKRVAILVEDPAELVDGIDGSAGNDQMLARVKGGDTDDLPLVRTQSSEERGMCAGATQHVLGDGKLDTVLGFVVNEERKGFVGECSYVCMLRHEFRHNASLSG